MPRGLSGRRVSSINYTASPLHSDQYHSALCKWKCCNKAWNEKGCGEKEVVDAAAAAAAPIEESLVKPVDKNTMLIIINLYDIFKYNLFFKF